MVTRTALAILAALALVPAAGGAEKSKLDTTRYMPLAEVQPGMTGIGRTTLQGTRIEEFQAEVLAVLENYGPKRDLILCRCTGAGLEETGIIAGMSGSPVYLDGRIIGAVAYSFRWSKGSIAGIQPIEQMLEVADRWQAQAKEEKKAAGAPFEPAAAPFEPRPEGRGDVEWRRTHGPAYQTTPRASARGSNSDAAFRVPASALGSALPPGAPALVPSAGAGGEASAYRMHPILTPVMTSGVPDRAMARLAERLAPYGLAPMAAGGVERDLPVAARLEPGAPLAVPMLRGDIDMTTMGTITDVVGDRVLAFGHAMFASGEADFPLMTGVAKVVIPSLTGSFRMGAAVKQVGRLVWDEEAGIVGRLTDQRARLVPVRLTVTRPDGAKEVFQSEMIQHRRLSGLLAGTVAGSGLIAHAELPDDHTVRYRVRVKPEGREPIVRENLAVSPNGDAYVEAVVRHVVGLVVENPFENLNVESVEVEATVEPGRRMAEIEVARPLKNAVRPGGTVPVELRIRPWREEPRWIIVNVAVPDDYPDGTYDLVLCDGEEALRQEQRESPARFHAEDLESLLDLVGTERPRDQLYVRLKRPGAGIAVGREELPNLPPSMRSVLVTSARRPVTAVTESVVTTRPMAWVLQGGQQVRITVDRHAPER